MKSKKQKMNMLTGLGILLSYVIINGCGSIPVPDVPVFADSPRQTYFFYTISDKEGVLDSDEVFFDPIFMNEPMTLEQLKRESVWMPGYSYGEIKKTLVKLCTKYKNDCIQSGNPLGKLERFEKFLRERNEEFNRDLPVEPRRVESTEQ